MLLSMDTHFRDSDIAFIVAGLLPVFAAILLFVRGKIKPALYFLIAGGFILRLCMALIDPYINLWDEQFHAMVAKNMMEHPFHPMLYAQPVLPVNDEVWTASATWLHKPPLFLWQIALFMKIFGTQYWVVRLPSVLLSTLAIPVVFRMGKILSGEQTGFFAALIFTIVNLQVNIISGFLNTDHNDVIFMCYVLFSIWSWMEHREKPKWKWILLTGLFSGMAILVKWLPGLLVYLLWISALLADKKERFALKKWIEPFVALLVTFIVAAPWFIYAAVKWPALSQHESEARVNHLSNVVEEHTGPWYYHFNLLLEDYGWGMVVLLPVCMLLFFLRKEKRSMRIAIGVAVLFVYAFYTCVPTRMPLFCLLVSPLLYMIIADVIANAGNYFQKLQEFSRNKRSAAIRFVLLAVSAYFIFNINRIEHFHTDRNPGNFYRPARIENKKQFENAAAMLPSKDIVIFNCGGFANGVACMFYTAHTSYTDLPTEEQFRKLKAEGIKMAVFDDIAIPPYLANDSAVIKLHFPLVRNGF
jgi:4-amino-4-deoxy-L-arabinose transferase